MPSKGAALPGTTFEYLLSGSLVTVHTWEVLRRIIHLVSCQNRSDAPLGAMTTINRNNTDADFRKWCGEVGFKRFEVIHLAVPSSAAVAYKYRVDELRGEWSFETVCRG